MSTKTANPVVHFEILGRDPSALRTFYGEAFGWSPNAPGEDPLEYSMVHLQQGSGGIDGGIGKAPQGPGHVTFYIGVPDLDAALETVQRLGGRTVQPPVSLPSGGAFALFADPEGHVVGLVRG
jgi:uncharacterized protein